MARPAVAQAKVAAAMAAVRAGATLADAAATHGVSLATLKRYRAANGSPSPARAKASQPPRQRTTPADHVSVPDPEDEQAAVLGLLRTELAYACRKRAAATKAKNESMEVRWSKRIEELSKVVERLEPPAAVPEDQVVARLRELDGETIGLIEQFLAQPIAPKEVAA